MNYVMHLLFKDIDVLGRPWLDERKGHYTFNQDPKGPILRKPSPKFCVALIADHYPKGIKTQEEIADFKGQQVLDLCSVSEYTLPIDMRFFVVRILPHCSDSSLNHVDDVLNTA